VLLVGVVVEVQIEDLICRRRGPGGGHPVVLDGLRTSLPGAVLTEWDQAAGFVELTERGTPLVDDQKRLEKNRRPVWDQGLCP
jgi:hypothetical protein